jgi:hypothetical protein
MQCFWILSCQTKNIIMKNTLQSFISAIKKKSILILFIICLSVTSFSQIYKGQWLIGGDAAFNSYKYYSTKTSAFTLSPAGGYFFLNKLAGGLRLSYYAGYYSYQPGGKGRETFLSVAPFIRYYFLSAEQKMNLFADGGYGYSWGKYKSRPQPDFRYHSKIISFKAGPVVLLNPHTALEITVGYDHSIRGVLIDTLATNSLQIGVGFQIHIGKQKE